VARLRRFRALVILFLNALATAPMFVATSGNRAVAQRLARQMAFILLGVGIQIMWNGWADLQGMKP
jgi:hypothetical protein